MRLLNTVEAGKRLGLTANTVINWCKSGRIEAHIYPGKSKSTYRIPESEIERLLSGQKEGA